MNRLPLIPGNVVTCYDCPMVGATAPNDGSGKPIAWCHAKGCVVAPERGCERHPLYYAKSRKEHDNA